MQFAIKPVNIVKIAFVVLFLCVHAGMAVAQAPTWKMPTQIEPQILETLLADEEKLDFYCLQQAYPQIRSLEARNDGTKWLVMDNGKKVLFSQPAPADKNAIASDLTPVAETMAFPYPLEPARPTMGPGEAPGRKRNRALLETLYGGSREEVARNAQSTKFRGKTIALSRVPAQAFAAMLPELNALAARQSSLAPYLESAGGFYWRKIAGENRMSPHSYGIAMDFGVDVSPYWRWAKVNPHPKQKTYPGELVRLMEDNGFIWGGKWHEYDLMHYEYRPELICKARIKAMSR